MYRVRPVGTKIFLFIIEISPIMYANSEFVERSSAVYGIIFLC